MADQVSGLLSPWLRSKRLNAARPHIRGRVLDFGCGTGLISELSQQGQYFGFDIDAESISLAREKYPQHTFYDSATEIDGQFDTVVSLAVIEHLRDVDGYLQTLKSHLKTDGQIVCSTPHPYFDWAHGLGAKIGLFSHEADDEHFQLFTQRSIVPVLEKNGLSLVAFHRFLFGANQLFIIKHSN
jgi:2-polyprenyl-3-methyl-5-hydroxy-6-metoxy-1,4-benzoquinol methylase